MSLSLSLICVLITELKRREEEAKDLEEKMRLAKQEAETIERRRQKAEEERKATVLKAQQEQAEKEALVRFSSVSNSIDQLFLLPTTTLYL